ncbi:hypothetical protein ACK8HX_01055 [Oryzobacter sp. R7]|uniref:hypothetical protein n=1 Tax=Oryzobacter faecalis TaxID=3388656 RepID=UPI00398CD69D
MSTEGTVVFVAVVAVVAGRFVLPLLIPRFPLPAIIACLVLDGVDQTIFQSFGFDPPGHQGYDKAMDVYYLAIAFLTTMRNWTRSSAGQVARFLFFYRMAGVMLFELIWVVVKLPQEYWIHVARLDVTDTLAAYAWAGPVLVVALLALAAAFSCVAVPRLPRTDHGWRVAADPLPEEMDTAAERDAWTATHVRVWSWWTLEKVALIGLLSVTYARILPGLRVGDLQMFTGIAAYVVVNVAITLTVARRVGSREGTAAAFGARVLVDLGLVVLARTLLGTGALDVADTLFFVLLLLVTFHDRYAPVGVARAVRDAREPVPVT